MLRLAAAGTVGMYQRHISPRKGFCCAYRVHTGRVSCSEFGRRVILKLGLVAFFRLMPRQFARCRAAFASINLNRQADAESDEKKRGILDRCDCGGCDIPTVNGCDAGGCDAGGCDAGGCDAGGCDVGGCSF